MWNFQLTLGEPCLPDYTLVFPVDLCLGVLTLKMFPLSPFREMAIWLYGKFVLKTKSGCHLKRFRFNIEFRFAI